MRPIDFTSPSPRATRVRHALGLSVLVAASTAGVSAAQEPTPSPAPPAVQPPVQQGPAADSAQALVSEFQRLQQQLVELQAQTLQESEELRSRQAAIDEMLNEAMLEINPEADAQMERLEALQQEAMAAQQAQDGTRLQTLMVEAQALQTELQSAQQQALARDEINEEIESFTEDLRAAMVQTDASAGQMLDRLDELAVVLGMAQPEA